MISEGVKFSPPPVPRAWVEDSHFSTLCRSEGDARGGGVEGKLSRDSNNVIPSCHSIMPHNKSGGFVGGEGMVSGGSPPTDPPTLAVKPTSPLSS